MGGLGSLLAGRPHGATSPLTAIWVAGAILVLGASTLGGVGRRHPSLLYPLTLLLGFVAFAIPYNALDEPWQSAMPAAGSIACMVALIAAVYTIILFFRPKSSLMASLGVVAVLLLLKGNAWFVDPNEFKSTFPNMESYYAQPIRLNSGDYFRDTTPSTVRLRNRDVTEEFDRLEKQDKAERLATAYFHLPPRQAASGRNQTLSLRIEDPRGRLRAAMGDKLRLASEEWFTTEVDGEDCVVLAEEPFFKKIYRDFRYEKLNMIRDGVIRGEDYTLAPEGEKTQKPNVTYCYQPDPGAGRAQGSEDLGAGGRISQARELGGREFQGKEKIRNRTYLYLCIGRGNVTLVEHSSHLDTYTVEFAYPRESEPLDLESKDEGNELTHLKAWLDRCHLDIVRPVQSARRRPERRNGDPGSEARGLPRSRGRAGRGGPGPRSRLSAGRGRRSRPISGIRVVLADRQEPFEGDRANA